MGMSASEFPEAASVAAVHESALRVLERTGVLVQDEDAVALLRSRGARCDGRRVFLDEDLVRRALATAPSSFVLAGRRPELGLPLGGADGRIYGSGSGAAYVRRGPHDAPRHPRRSGDDGQAGPPTAGDRLQQRLHGAARPSRGGTHPPRHARPSRDERQGDRVGRLGRRGRRRGRVHQRDPLRRGVARPPPRPDRAEHHRAAADLRRDGADHAALGPAGTARVHDLVRDGRDHGPGDRSPGCSPCSTPKCSRHSCSGRRLARARHSSMAACR